MSSNSDQLISGRTYKWPVDRANQSFDGEIVEIWDNLGLLTVSGILMALFIVTVLARFFPELYQLRKTMGLKTFGPKDDKGWVYNCFRADPIETFGRGVSMDQCCVLLMWIMGQRLSCWFLIISPFPLIMNYFGSGYCEDLDNPASCEAFDPESIYWLRRLTVASLEQNTDFAFGLCITQYIIMIIILFEMVKAQNVYKQLRHRWLLSHNDATACSVMVVLSTLHTDYDFRHMFETVFPGQVVDAQLLKFCPELSNLCLKIDFLEDEIEFAILAAKADLARKKVNPVLVMGSSVRVKNEKRRKVLKNERDMHYRKTMESWVINHASKIEKLQEKLRLLEEKRDEMQADIIRQIDTANRIAWEESVTKKKKRAFSDFAQTSQTLKKKETSDTFDILSIGDEAEPQPIIDDDIDTDIDDDIPEEGLIAERAERAEIEEEPGDANLGNFGKQPGVYDEGEDNTPDLHVADGVVVETTTTETRPGVVLRLPSGMEDLESMEEDDASGAQSPVSMIASPRIKWRLNTMMTMEMNRVRMLPNVKRQGLYKNRELFSTIGFVTFKNREIAFKASQMMYCENPTEWQVKMAPDPKSVYFHHIATKPVATNQLNRKTPYLIYVGLFIALPFLGLLNSTFMTWVEDPETKIPKLVKVACSTLVTNSAMKYFLLITPSIFKVAFVYAGRMDRAWNFHSIQNAQFTYTFLFVLLASPVSDWVMVVLNLKGNNQSDSSLFAPILGIGGVVMTVISNFTRIITFAAFSFVTLSCGLVQLRRIRYYLGYRFYYRLLPEDSWKNCRIWNKTKWTVPLRMNEGAFMITIFFVYYIAVPLIAVLFVLLMVFARAVTTYRMFYMDYAQDVDTGGVYWRNFQTHVLLVSAFAQTLVVIIICDLAPQKLSSGTIIMIFVPLYLAMAYIFRKIEKQRWEHLVIQHPDLHKPKRNPVPTEYPFVQPQLWDRNILRTSFAGEEVEQGQISTHPTMHTLETHDSPSGATGSTERKNYSGMGRLLRSIEKDLRKKPAWRNINIRDYRIALARGLQTAPSLHT